MKLLEESLIRFCAPTLLNKKYSNMFSFPLAQLPKYILEIQKLNFYLVQFGLHIEYLYHCSQRVFVFLYRKNKLQNYLKNSIVSEYLSQLGYPDPRKNSFFDVITFLKMRLLECKINYPHEIGFFLGYPIYDVLEYMKQNGQNCKLCGYWKVYFNESFARETFMEYKRCKEILTVQSESGISLLQILKDTGYKDIEGEILWKKF